jgi:transposase
MNTQEENEALKIPEGFEALPKPFQDFIYQLMEEIKALRTEVAELRLRLAKDSSNSNNPPSTDQYGRKSKPRSEREKSGKKTGGQPGHPGLTLEPTSTPDAIKNYNVNQCNSCRADLSSVQATAYISRQECDIPPVKPVITEHRMVSKVCPKCKSVNTAQGPKNLTQPIQYGPKVNAIATYLHYGQLLPLKRIRDLLKDLFSLCLSEGTLVKMYEKLYAQLENTELDIRKDLLQSAVNNCDETSMYMNGKTYWLHVFSNATATGYFIHPKRGIQAMNAMNMLPQYQGIAVHDHYLSYFTYEHIKHALCNAHHIRELRSIAEDYNQPWCKQMRQFLLEVNTTVWNYKEAGKTELPPEMLKKFSDTYDSILDLAQSQIPSITPTQNSKKRGRIKQHPAKNLLDRLSRRKKETLLFMIDFRVPFTNNQAERDIRMAKLKQKTSGCFRSKEGADRFCRIRSFISTSRKRNINVIHALEDSARGQPAIHA